MKVFPVVLPAAKFLAFCVVLSLSPRAHAVWSMIGYEYEEVEYTNPTAGSGTKISNPLIVGNNEISSEAGVTDAVTSPNYGSSTVTVEIDVQGTFSWSGGGTATNLQFATKIDTTISVSGTSGTGTKIARSHGDGSQGPTFNLEVPDGATNSISLPYEGSTVTVSNTSPFITERYRVKSYALAAMNGAGTRTANSSVVVTYLVK